MTPRPMRGIVREVLPKGRYRCALPDGAVVVAGCVGASRVAPVRLLPGDEVEIEREPRDPAAARILGRGELPSRRSLKR